MALSAQVKQHPSQGMEVLTGRRMKMKYLQNLSLEQQSANP